MPVFSCDLTKMTARGIVWDKVEKVTSKNVEGSSPFMSPTFEADCKRILETWEKKWSTEDASKETIRRALMHCDD